MTSGEHEELERPVQLYVYDLSQGLARQFSLGFLGTHIDAVYHTSIVIGNREFYYGQGIQSSPPGQTHHGPPLEKLPLGTTSLPDSIIHEYLDSLRPIYSPEAYDLFMHNCNNFTNDIAQFLCGRGIPEHITELPQTVLNTPFGKMLKPALEQSLRPITTAGAAAAPMASGTAPPGGSLSSQYYQQPLVKVPCVKAANSLVELEKLLSSALDSCAVVFFTSAGCPPCRTIYPIFERLSEELGEKAVFVKVDISTSQDAARKYQITATPTFVTFLNGEKVEEWQGASAGDLNSRVEMLVRMAYPPHPHTTLRLPILLNTPLRPTTYTKIPPLEKLLTKLGKTGQNPIVLSIRDFIVAKEAKGAIETRIPAFQEWVGFLKESFKEEEEGGLPVEMLFPLVDLFRVLLVDPRCSGWFAEEKDHATIKTLLQKATLPQTPYPLHLLTLQATTNLFTTPLFPPHLTTPPLSPLITTLITTSLLSSSSSKTHPPTIRVAATALLLNVAIYIYTQRTTHEREVMREDDLVELVAGTVECLKSERESKEVVKGLVVALGLITYCAPVEGGVVELERVLEAAEAVREVGGRGLVEERLWKEVVELLEV